MRQRWRRYLRMTHGQWVKRKRRRALAWQLGRHRMRPAGPDALDVAHIRPSISEVQYPVRSRMRAKCDRSVHNRHRASES